MKNRVTVTIADGQYTIIAEDSEEYIKKIAAMVDDKIQELKSIPGATLSNAIVLTAVNFADEFQKARSGSAGIRSRLKDYLEEISRLQSQLTDARKEIRHLQAELKSRSDIKR